VNKRTVGMIIIAAIVVIFLLWITCNKSEAASFTVGDYRVHQDNWLNFVHYGSNATLLNEINYESYTYFGVRAIDLYLHVDAAAGINKPTDDIDFGNPRTVFSSSLLGDWSTLAGVGTKIGPATFEVFQLYSDNADGQPPTNLSVGLKW